MCVLPQTRRRLGGRQPLCGTGVTSLMPVTSMPVFWIERMAVSRPEPGPFTWTSTLRTPCSMARRAAASAASCAANGVDLREPLKPTLPAEAHETVFPWWSVIVMIVLLNDDLMWATPYATFLRSRRRGRRPPGFGFATNPSLCSCGGGHGPVARSGRGFVRAALREPMGLGGGRRPVHLGACGRS